MIVATAELEKSSLSNEIKAKRNRYNGEGAPEGITEYQTGWDIYDNSIETYFSEAFWSVSLEKEIYELIRSRKGLVAIDFLSSTAALASLFKKNPNGAGLGLAVSMEDDRNEAQRARDLLLGIHQISGDISSPATWDKVEERLQTKKADLIFERAAGGLDYIPAHRRFYAIAMRKAWQLLSPHNGMMLVQTPKVADIHAFDIDMYEWVDILTENQIDALYEPYTSFFGGALRLIKTVDSPPQLPLLPR